MNPITSRRAQAIAFLIAGFVLFVQIVVHRIVSAKLLNNFAFLIISLTMLGFALSGVALSFRLTAWLRRLPEVLWVSTVLMVLATLGATVCFYHAEIEQLPHIQGDFVVGFLKTLPYGLLFALPFVFAGVILGILLAAPDLPARRIYFYDLMGSGLGAFIVIPAIHWLGAESALLVACAVALLATAALVPPRTASAAGWGAAAALAVVGCAWGRQSAFAMRYPAGSVLGDIQRTSAGTIEAIVWDPVARIEMSRTPPPTTDSSAYPSLIGSDPAFHQRFRRILTQNNYAFTYAVDYDGTRESLRGIEETMYAAAYQARTVERPRVGIVGVGGGFDVLTALAFDPAEVIGVEINAATMFLVRDRYRDYFRHWTGDPRVHLVLGEGRHYLATLGDEEKFDVLQLSGVDSYAGTAAAAHVFSESYLYTAEAFDLFLDRLSERGVLNLMRLEYAPPREMLRALVTAVAALRRRGVSRPADHIVVLTQEPQDRFTALLVKRTPFAPEEIRRLADWAERNPWIALSAPSPRQAGLEDIYRAFLELQDPARERTFVAGYPYDISPTEDDRPFFFKHSFWWHLSPRRGLFPVVAPAMEWSVLLLFAVIGLCTLVCVYLPLRHLAKGGAFAPATRRYGLFFAGTGLGYLAIEIALLQKFGLFLGHPNYALSVVLASLLVTSGLGSLFSARIVSALGQLRFVAYVLSALILLEQTLLLPRLRALVGLPFVARVAVAFALIAPLGLCLGTFLPSALAQLKVTAPAFAPWAWGLNGIFSVLSPVLSVALSMTWGIGALLLASVPVYLAAALAWPSPAAVTAQPGLEAHPGAA